MAYAPPRVSGSRVAKATKEKQPPASDMLRRITRSMTTDASRRAVFNTTELLEKVISFLAPFEILTKVQRVSSGWKNTIANSPTVQALLWRPRVTRVLTPSVHSHEIEATSDNPNAALYLRYPFISRVFEGDLATGIPKYSEAVAFQELFFTKPGGADKDGVMELLFVDATAIGDINTALLSWVYDMETTSHGSRPTWCDVYITLPPITTAQMSVFLKTTSEVSEWIYVTVYDRNGITYGTTIGVLNKMRGPRPAWNSEELGRICFVAEGTEPNTAASEN